VLCLDRFQLHLRTRGQLLLGNAAEKGLDLGDHMRRVHVACDDENGVVGRVPGFKELVQHLSRGLVKRGARAQCVMGVGRSLEHGIQQLGVEDVLRIGEV
jgi:hypothetical protein